ncbi:MAG: hypothetical protein NZ828_11385 [Alphaproteobacteria bacterium]|nr:hypothetical protein [Alphaproteobacteria bacterium]
MDQGNLIHSATLQSLPNLFVQYLDVCNRAIDANKHRFPFKQIMESVRDVQTHKNVEVIILDDHPPVSCVICFDDNQKITTQPAIGVRGLQKWRVSKAYLENVINNPDEYIQNPAKIDWEWLYHNNQ